MTKRISIRGQRPAKKPYHYRACGLDDVYLTDGFVEEKTAYGPAVTITDVPGLHRAIGRNIISQGKPLSAREFRFLRKNMDLTQEVLAARLDLDGQTIARYEKDQTAVPRAIDIVVRVMFALHVAPPDRREEMIEEIRSIVEDELSQTSGPEREFGLTKKGWRNRAVHVQHVH